MCLKFCSFISTTFGDINKKHLQAFAASLASSFGYKCFRVLRNNPWDILYVFTAICGSDKRAKTFQMQKSILR